MGLKNRVAYIREGAELRKKKQCFKMSYSNVDKNMLFMYWFLIEL